MVDTAVKTAFTGYIQRRLVKMMESLSIHYDNTVRDSKKNVVQWFYGCDSFNARYIEKVHVPLLVSSEARLRQHFYIQLPTADLAAFLVEKGL